MTIQETILLVGASAIAGAMNSVAGGGTMLTFPALLAAGQLSTVANATSTVALWPGQISSLWALREEIKHNAHSIVPLSIIGIIGGIIGAQALVYTPPSLFDRIVPFLILLATIIFMAQEPLAKWQRERTSPPPPPSRVPSGWEQERGELRSAEESVSGERVRDSVPTPLLVARNSPLSCGAGEGGGGGEVVTKTLPFSFGIGVFLFLVALYGGYFGAGIGILTLAAFGLMGLTNIHQMNALKAIFTIGINGIAAAIFIFKGLVDWRIAGIMALGSLFGGYAGAGIAKKIGQKNVRRIVIAIGLILAVTQFIKAFVR